jgi:hypothetical protein
MEDVEAGSVRYIPKNDGSAIDKATRRNRPRKGVLHWSVRPTRAHASLLGLDSILFNGVLL